EPAAETPTGFPEPVVETPSGFPEQIAKTPSGFGPEVPSESSEGFGPAAEPMADFPSAPAAEVPTGFGPESDALADFPSAPDTGSPFETAAPPAGEGAPETQFAKLVEQFVEAVQNGADDREAVKDRMLAACATTLAEGSGATDDHRQFCQVMTEFVNYISENQFLDDIRVMNLLSNVTDPVWEWARADAASRAGMMGAAYDVLRDYKSLFE
ncbi:MAG: hypothetical protein ACRDGA_00395, partial [Bacteroidota bacterium]